MSFEPSPPSRTVIRRARRCVLAATLTLSACGSGVTVAAQAPGAAPVDAAPATSAVRQAAPVVRGERLPPARVGLNPERNRNERNEPIELDETALLACANAQFGWVAAQQGDPDTAAKEIETAVARAAESDVAALKGAANSMRATGDPAARAEAFLRVCENHGYIR